MISRATLLATAAIVISLVAISATVLPLMAQKETPTDLLTERTITSTVTVSPTIVPPPQNRGAEASTVSALNASNVVYTTMQTNTILVNGVGEVKVKPDRVKIYMGVFTEAQQVQAAVEQNAEIFQKILSALAGVGVQKEAIETVSYSIMPIYEYPQYGRPILVGFRVDHQIVVTVEGSEVSELGVKAGEVIDAAFSSGANELMNIAFTISDEEAKVLTEQARSFAVADAKARAETIAKGLNVTIVGVLQAVESYGYYPQPIPVRAEVAAEFAKAPTEILPGALTISVSVQVTFIIADLD